jgi:hypothetical protein
VQQGHTAFHPLLFAAAPALSVFVDNYDQLDYGELLWPGLCCEAPQRRTQTYPERRP